MSQDSSLRNRIAIVTGASAGIGHAAALTLARRGAAVVINARRRERLDETARQIQSAGGRCLAVPGDAAEHATIIAMLDGARTLGGKEADLVVVNAGRGLSGSPLGSDTAQWEQMVRTNLLGAAMLIRESAARMKTLAPVPEATRQEADAPWRRTPRDIVVISSTVGKNISPFSSMYGSTKFAITSIAEAARRELAPTGIRVSAIHPAVVRSEFQQVAGYDAQAFGQFMDRIGPVLEPSDIADLIAHLCALPAHVCMNDVTIRPVRQEYP